MTPDIPKSSPIISGKKIPDAPTKPHPAILILKYGSLALFSATLVCLVLLKADLDESNSYLGMISPESKNTGSTYKELSETKQKLLSDISNIQRDTKRMENQLETKVFSNNTERIQKIKNDQLVWFDREDDNGKFLMGLINSPQHMADYINSPEYTILEYKPLSTLKGGRDSLDTPSSITISNVNANRNNLSFNFVAENEIDRVFALAINFIDMMNTFPMFESGSLTSFRRDVSESGRDFVQVGLRMNVSRPDVMPQEKDIEDRTPRDEAYIEFEKWIQLQYAPEYLEKQLEEEQALIDEFEIENEASETETEEREDEIPTPRRPGPTPRVQTSAETESDF